jgi:hypothetical protein
MKTRTRVTAVAVAASLLGGVSVAAADSAERAPQRSSVLASGAARAVPTSGQAPGVSQSDVRGPTDIGSTTAFGMGRVGLRSVRPCVFRGRPTRCVIKVRRLEQRRNRVVAIGTITPRSNPRVHIPFQKRVIGVGTADGIFGLQAAPPSCAILNLVLGPLHLDVLGLVIDLNRVVLNIVGQTGAGNLLGNLLCALTGILDGGVILARFLSVLDDLLAAINAVLRL